jgi:hypothetical protein
MGSPEVVDMRFVEKHTATSGVAEVEIGDRSITVRFAEGGTYLYDQTRPGKVHVAQMISLARAGAGLATYINQQVRGNYARKLD